MKKPRRTPSTTGLKNQSGKIDSTATKTVQAIDRDTSTASQQRRILQALRISPKTTSEIRALGVLQSSARIFGLRAMGYNITTELFDGYASDGYSHQRMARYTLHEPADQHDPAAVAPASCPVDLPEHAEWLAAFGDETPGSEA